MVIATNVTRLLEAKGIPYRGLEIPIKKMNALEVAVYLEVSP